MQTLIEKHAREAGLDTELVSALIQVESSGNPFAWNPA